MTHSTFVVGSVLTVDEANLRLPLIEKIIGDLVSTWDRIHVCRADLERLCPTDPAEKLFVEDLHGELNRLVGKIHGCVREIEDLGGRVVEFRRGLVAFPGELDGRRVNLSWSPGEKSFAHYYELHENYPLRRALPGE